MSQQKELSRREALKTLAAVTGAAALTSLPGQWVKPVIETGLLPAHAQSSQSSAAGCFELTYQYDSSDPVTTHFAVIPADSVSSILNRETLTCADFPAGSECVSIDYGDSYTFQGLTVGDEYYIVFQYEDNDDEWYLSTNTFTITAGACQTYTANDIDWDGGCIGDAC